MERFTLILDVASERGSSHRRVFAPSDLNTCVALQVMNLFKACSLCWNILWEEWLGGGGGVVHVHMCYDMH